jgi:hypothetical protein
MRVMFAAYCMINNENGDSLIGVYKRALRTGMEMVRRGHEVWMFCPGRELYRDELARAAEASIHFLDIPLKALFCRSDAVKRRYYEMVFRRLRLDLVVVGEAPLDGTLLDTTICAMSLGIRLVVLDNAYSPWMARTFVRLNGRMFDGIVLTGPSSLHMRQPPEYYCAAPPYIEGSSAEAQALLQQSGLLPTRLVTVLGYEKKAEQLAVALFPKLMEHGCAAVFLSPDPQESCKRMAALPPHVAQRILVLPSPSENLLFGLLQLSSLVIGKCGFMQVSECLALGTPFLAITYRGCFSLKLLPSPVRRFVHATDAAQIVESNMEAAVRLIHTSRDEIRSIHDGSFGARSMVADFLERLPPGRRKGTVTHILRRHRLVTLLTLSSARLFQSRKT